MSSDYLISAISIIHVDIFKQFFTVYITKAHLHTTPRSHVVLHNAKLPSNEWRESQCVLMRKVTLDIKGHLFPKLPILLTQFAATTT